MRRALRAGEIMAKAKVEYLRKSASISNCGTFRYFLMRRWDLRLKNLVFVMLNPSTADAEEDDATIRKCVGFAQRFGYGGIIVLNLFAYRVTDPKDLKKAGFPVGPENDMWLKHAAEVGCDIVCAWGVNANRTARPAQVVKMLREAGAQLKCLDVTGDGWPSHPLMLSYDRQLRDYAPC